MQYEHTMVVNGDVKDYNTPRNTDEIYLIRNQRLDFKVVKEYWVQRLEELGVFKRDNFDRPILAEWREELLKPTTKKESEKNDNETNDGQRETQSSDDQWELLRKQYEEKFGKKVSNLKKNDLEWIASKLAE